MTGRHANGAPDRSSRCAQTAKNMDPNWLNRIGIILNFLAGFLIAPELIGLDRIRKAEQRLEDSMEKVSEWATKRGRQVRREWQGSPFVYPPYNPKFYISFFVVLWTFVSVVIFLNVHSVTRTIFYVLAAWVVSEVLFVVTWVILELLIQDVLFPRAYKAVVRTQAAQSNRSALLGLTMMIPLGCLPASLRFILGFILFVQGSPFAIIGILGKNTLSFVYRILSGHDRLRSLLVSLGIIFFILGNLLQLWATF